MPGQLAPVNAPIVQYTSLNSANSIPERDSNGDTYFARARAATALVSAGGLQVGQIAKTGNYSAAETNEEIWCDATSGALTITLPAAATSAGWRFHITKVDTSVNAVTIDGNASEQVNGDLTQVLHFQWESAELACDGTKWVMRRTVHQRVSAKSANFTVGGLGPVYAITVGAGVITVTLPPAAEMKDVPITLKRVDGGAGSVSLTTNSTETVDGTNDPTGLFNGAGTQYDVLVLLSDGSNYHYMADRGPAT